MLGLIGDGFGERKEAPSAPRGSKWAEIEEFWGSKSIKAKQRIQADPGREEKLENPVWDPWMDPALQGIPGVGILQAKQGQP